MASYTEQYNLKKPSYDDFCDVKDFNDNFDKIDTEIRNVNLTGTGIRDSLNAHTMDKSNPHGVTKSQVGLGNVDNTSDANKPVSTAQQTAITAVENKIIGKSLAGKSVKPTNDTSETAGTGAEIFNDYRERTFTAPKGDKSVQGNVASGSYAHAEGEATTAGGKDSHAEGLSTIASAPVSHAEGRETNASGSTSHAEGRSTTASGENAHSEGISTTASGYSSHSEGNYATANGKCSHAEGWETTASKDATHAEGRKTTASELYSHAEGYGTTANGVSCHAEGSNTTASEFYSHAGGINTIAKSMQFVTGKYNTEKDGCIATENSADLPDEDSQDSAHSIFIIGNGTSTATSNAFRITADGQCRGTKAFIGSGADFAEYFEWLDGNPDNEDRRGKFVTLDGDRIKLANDGDYILGIVSATGAFIGNSQSEDWQGKYLKDVYGDWLTQEVTVPEKTDGAGNVIPEHTSVQYVVNPDFDPATEYISREFRKEWSPVGMLGQVVIVDDGTCIVNGYCKPLAKGIGTAADSGYRVLKRLDNTHVKALVR